MRPGLARPLPRPPGTLPPGYPGDGGPPLRRDYLDRLAEIHARLRPETYLEIGVFSGRSLALAGPGTLAVGVDPVPAITEPLSERTRVFTERSDDFFARGGIRDAFGDRPLDLVFVDGLHLFEYALRDVANVAPFCTPRTRIVVHDTLPVDRRMAARTRETQAWTGDVWKLVPALRHHSPHLDLATIDTPPSGLTIISGIDPGDGTLRERYEAIVEDFVDLDFVWFERHGREQANTVPDGPDAVAALLP